MWSPVFIFTLISTSAHLSSTTAHIAKVQISESSQTSSRGCKLPTEISATVKFDDSSISLHLTKNEYVDINAPIFTEKTGQSRGIKTESVLDIQGSGTYQDMKNEAAMTVDCTKGAGLETHLSLHGFISYKGKQYTLQEVKSKRKKRDTSTEYEMIEEKQPVMMNDFRIPDPVEPSYTAIKENIIFSPLKSANNTRHKRQTSQYFIDVLALIDYGIYKRWYDDSTQSSASLKKQDALQNIRRYFAYVMNGVNLRYKSITGLTSLLNVRLVGYYVSETADMAPWTETFRISGTVRSEVDADKVLVYLRDWVPTRSLPQHDHAMLFTGYDLYTISDLTGAKSIATSGLAYIRTLCRSDGRSISLVEDFGGFQCVDTAAHELGHSLGAKHDGDGNTCKPGDRYIMSGGTYQTTDDNIQNPWFFSTCSVDYFRSYLSTLSMSSVGIRCLTGPLSQNNVPNISGSLPGQLYVPDQQCKMIHGDSSRLCQGPEFGNSSQVCTNMFCLDPNSEGTCFQHDAARGTSCGNRRWCIDGVCQYSEDAPTAVEGCVFGDQAGISFDDKTCAEFTSGENSAYCYQNVVRGRCCASCQKYYTGAEECLYGNKVRGCDSRFCDFVYEDGTRYADNCCQTCGSFTTISPTTTTIRVEVTTQQDTTTRPPATTTEFNCDSNYGDTIGVTFDGMRCEDYVEADPSVCYVESTRRYCCASCKEKETGGQGCEYGNRFVGCDLDLCDYVFSDGTLYKTYCCETCNITQTTLPPTTTTSTTPTTTTPTTITPTTTTTTTTTPTTTPTTTTTTTTTPTTTTPTTTTTTTTTPSTTTSTTTTTTTTTPTTTSSTTTTTPTTTTTTTTTPTTTPTTTTTTTTTRTTTTPTTTTTTPTNTASTTTRSTTTADKCSDTIFGVGCRSYLQRYGRGRCYNSYVSSVCCTACQSVADNNRPDCLYGDILVVCHANQCGTILNGGSLYDDLCCETCANATSSSTEQPTTTSTTYTTTTTKHHITSQLTTTVSKSSSSVSTTSLTTTTATTTTSCVDTAKNCSALIQRSSAMLCYRSDVIETCCATCTTYKDVSNTGCEYGDRVPDLCVRLTSPLAESCLGEGDNCCSTCGHIINAAAVLISSPIATFSTIITILYIMKGL